MIFGNTRRRNILKLASVFVFGLSALVTATQAQETKNTNDGKSAPPAKKANQRSAAPAASEPFDKADVKTMESQCVKLETEAGGIEIELFPALAPETVRNFLNLAATGFYETTTFSRVVPNFVIQGGNLASSQKITAELIKRAKRTIPDEPNQVKHERGIVSMARSDEPNTSTTHFFILVSSAPNLDGTFAAFGRVTKGMDVVDAINKMPVDGDKPAKPVRLNRTIVAPCPARAEN